MASCRVVKLDNNVHMTRGKKSLKSLSIDLSVCGIIVFKFLQHSVNLFRDTHDTMLWMICWLACQKIFIPSGLIGPAIEPAMTTSAFI